VGVAFEEALNELQERLSAIGVDDPGVTMTLAEPDALQRRLLSGYVPPEETEQAMQFLAECGDALLGMVGQAGSHRAMIAGLRTAVAQVLILGVVLERKTEEDG
jgi:hypothetical protein